MIKLVTYCSTIAAAMFFAFWEMRLKRQLAEDFKPSNSPSDFGLLNDISENVKREQFLQGLPKQAKTKLKRIVLLKFLFFVLLVAEVILLQKS